MLQGVVKFASVWTIWFEIAVWETWLEPNYGTDGDQLQKIQIQGLPAGDRTRVLWITRPVLYHWATEAVVYNLGASYDTRISYI